MSGERSLFGSKWLGLVLMIALPVALVLWGYVSLRSSFSSDDAEAEILNMAWRLCRGQSLYRGINTPPYVFALYPPAYYAATAFFLKFVGLSFLPAELISAASTLAVGAAVYLLARGYNASAREGLSIAALLFFVPAFLFNSLRCHPQMMATMFTLASLFFFLRGERFGRLVVSPLLAAFALYTKQTEVALPMAVAVFLVLRDRRALLAYLGVLVTAVLLPAALLDYCTGGSFLFDVISLAIPAYHARVILPQLYGLLGPIAILLCVVSYCTARRFGSRCWDVLDLYFVILLLITTVSLGRLGSDAQYVLQLVVVSFVCLARESAIIHGWQNMLLKLQFTALVAAAPWLIVHNKVLPQLTAIRSADTVYRALRKTDGPILSEKNSFPLFVNGEIYVQLFHFEALQRAGRWNEQPLLDRANESFFAAVVTEFPLDRTIEQRGDRMRFSPELVQALRSHYELALAAYPYYVYLPRRPKAADLQSKAELPWKFARGGVDTRSPENNCRE
ncbi:MAG: glycosyltransferase family 39 protein [Chthoniobacterales bacterium]